MKKLAIILLFLFPLSSFAGLTFGAATSDRVAITGDASFQDKTTFTTAMWVYPTTFTDSRVLWALGTSDRKRIALSTPLSFGCRIAKATTNAVSVASNNTLTLNAWNFIACTWTDGAAPKIYIGTRTSLVEESSYASQSAGSGANSSESGGNMQWGNSLANNLALQGRIGWGGYWDRELTLGELKQQQFSPHKTSGNQVFMHLGFSGLTTQTDWSGARNNGTITGATLSRHVPLGRLF